jgi:hypothetical protein
MTTTTTNKATQMGFHRGTLLVDKMDVDGADSSFHYTSLLEVDLVDAEGNPVPTSKAGALFVYGLKGVKPQTVLNNVFLKARSIEGLYDAIMDEEAQANLLLACGLDDIKQLEVPPVVMAASSKTNREEARSKASARKMARRAAMEAGNLAPATETTTLVAQPDVV